MMEVPISYRTEHLKSTLEADIAELRAYINDPDYDELEKHDCRVALEAYERILAQLDYPWLNPCPKRCSFISDNTPDDMPNTLIIAQREDGDIELLVSARHARERGISIRSSGSRHKNYAEIIRLFSKIIDLINAPISERRERFASKEELNAK